MVGKKVLSKKRVARILTLLCERLVSIAGEVGATLIFLMALLVTLDVTMRYFFNVTTGIATETSGYTLVAIAFLGLAHTQRTGRNVRVELITKKLSPKRRDQLQLATLSLFLAFTIWFAYFTMGPVIFNYTHHTISPTVMHTRMWIPYLFIPLGVFVLALELIAEVIQKSRSYISTYRNMKDMVE